MNTPSRIVVVHDNIEARGGATALARLSAQLYRKMGFEVTYICGARDDCSLNEYGIDVIGLGSSSLATGPAYRTMSAGLYNFRTMEVLSDWISKNDTPDTVYHLHNWAQSLSPSVFKALRSVEQRTIVSCHDLFNVCPNGGLINFRSGKPCQLNPMSSSCWASQCDRRSPVHKYWRMFRHLQLLRLADFNQSKMTFVCLHEGMEELMRKRGFNPPNLTNNPNPASSYVDDRVEAETNRKFLFIGRLNREKGADLAVAAAIEADVELTMIGDGEIGLEFERRHPNVEFTGFCTKEEIAGHAREARALIVPGRWPEPYGLVIAEAALSGIPVLISRPSLLSSRVVDMQMGEAFDEAELASFVQRWKDDDAIIESFSLNAYEHAGSICSKPEVWAARFVEIMSEKLDKQK